jgi:uncharacterized protein (TIGR02996 family)
MTDEREFLRAIREKPDDDTVRLAFADWLEEGGDPDRAELIRVQCELEPVRFEIDRPRVEELVRREEELFHAHEEEWETRGRFRWGEGYGPYLRRGVPEVACVSLDFLLKEGEEFFAAYPTLRELAVFGVYYRCDQLARLGLLARLDVLEIADWVSIPDAEALLRLPRVGAGLTLRVWTGGGEGNLHLYSEPERWPSGARVEVLDLLSGASLSAAGVFDDVLDELAIRYAAAGRSLLPLRPQAVRFPLKPDQGQNLHPGRFADGKPVLVAHGFPSDPLVIATFNEGGELIQSHECDNPDCCRYYEDYPGWLAKEYGYRPGMIWMREFITPQGLGLQLWPSFMCEDWFDRDPGILPERVSEREWNARGGDAWDWLQQAKYIINWCNTPWASRRTGEITDT